MKFIIGILIIFGGLVMYMPWKTKATPADATVMPTIENNSPQKDDMETPYTVDQNLIVYTIPVRYTYDDFVQDMVCLEKLYGDRIICKKLCDTVDNRGVYDIIVGDPNSDKQILIFGAMHAREYITSQVIMRQLCDSIDALNGYGGEYNGIRTKELLQDVAIHFVPMSNPDGISISQFGLNGIMRDTVRQSVSAMVGSDYEQWKSNANGVDLNRNFDAGWDEYIGRKIPSAERYKGAFPGSEPESEALIQLVKKYNIKRTISYHTCGDLIYWYYKQSGDVLEASRLFAQRISDETRYPLDSDCTAVDAAGFKDWAVYKMGIPSLTIEVGSEDGYSVENPVPVDRFGRIWERNRNVVYATVYNLKYES